MSDGVIHQHARDVAEFLAAASDAEGYVTGWSQRAAATMAGLTYYQFRDGLHRLAILGAAKTIRSGNATLPPVYRILLPLDDILARIGAPTEATSSADPSMAERSIRDRVACDRMLARLLKFHGRNPPDAEAAAAVARLRAAFTKDAFA